MGGAVTVYKPPPRAPHDPFQRLVVKMRRRIASDALALMKAGINPESVAGKGTIHLARAQAGREGIVGLTAQILDEIAARDQDLQRQQASERWRDPADAQRAANAKAQEIAAKEPATTPQAAIARLLGLPQSSAATRSKGGSSAGTLSVLLALGGKQSSGMTGDEEASAVLTRIAQDRFERLQQIARLESLFASTPRDTVPPPPVHGTFADVDFDRDDKRRGDIALIAGRAILRMARRVHQGLKQSS